MRLVASWSGRPLGSCCYQFASAGEAPVQRMADSLLAQAEDKEALAPVQRISKNPAPEVQTDNAIRDNLPGWSSTDLYGKLVDGKTLHHTILADKTANHEKKGSVVMGLYYYDILRRKYRDHMSVEQQLSATDQSAKIQTRLFDAVMKSQKAPPQRGAMLLFLQVCMDLSQAEMVGTCRFVLKLRPSLSVEQLICGLEAMRCWNRLQVLQQFKKEIDLMRPCLSDICVQVPYKC